MNAALNDDPMGSDYWKAFDEAVKRVEVARNRRDDLYEEWDPAAWGWRRPTLAELQRERESNPPAR